ncbi:hypothetical protein HDU99_005875 [Rhizoclosmatium hyalinum]|nr:hypothetical protein HDU99_005875 [Rhizoclosmatium hyalinum]
MSFNSQELVSQSTLTASSTSADAASCYNNSCDINNIKQTAPNDASNHLTMWKSDGSCGAQTIRSNWGNLIPQSISSLSVLYTPDSSNAGVKTQTVVLSKKDGSTVDVSNYLLCTTASVSDAGKPVRWDICALSSSAPGGTYDNVVGASFVFQPSNSGSGGCTMGIYELQVHGINTPGATQPLTTGAIVGIILAVLVVIAIGGLCFVRQANLRKRAARWLNQPRGGWESLELWAADRAEHHD